MSKCIFGSNSLAGVKLHHLLKEVKSVVVHFQIGFLHNIGMESRAIPNREVAIIVREELVAGEGIVIGGAEDLEDLEELVNF